MFEGIIGTIIGTILGFFLSEWSAKRREERSEKKQVQSTRSIVRLEIDRNLKILQEFWPKISQVDNSENSVETQKRAKAGRFAQLPFFLWSREVLDSQLSFLSIALREQELVQVFQFYDSIYRLEIIRSDLLTAFTEDEKIFREETSPGPGGFRSASFGYLPPQKFGRRVEALWDECDRLVAQVLANGNPLKTTK